MILTISVFPSPDADASPVIVIRVAPIATSPLIAVDILRSPFCACPLLNLLKAASVVVDFGACVI